MANRRKENQGHRATSYDVARLAGVSQSAVSRVFKPGASASAEMRERVHKAARDLGYRPNAIARGLITQRSNMVGVIISRLTNLYYPEVLVQLTQRFGDQGVRVLLFALEQERDIDDILDQVLQYRVDGVVTAARLDADQLALFDNAGIPVVFYNRDVAGSHVNSVRCDQADGERWLVERLLAAGHRSFGIISGPEDSFVSNERIQGAIQPLREHGIEQLEITHGDFDYESGYAGIGRLISAFRGDIPDVVICANDVTAIGCIDGARGEHNLSVPQQLSVVGFDGVGPAGWAAYRLTTIRQPVRRMTESAVAMLMDRIENPLMTPEKRVFAGIPIGGDSARLREPTLVG
ncbi:MAG: LacI family DNA-binding transcriptional regulator [Gammaproteobacteria bacterium]|nr:LacI family DNA-binding transcriptional regulator [Gammaproteobacteria bacterium]